MTLEAVAAMLLDYAAVGFVVGLLVFDRWMGIHRGIVLDTLLMLIVLMSAAVWFAGSRRRRRLTVSKAGTGGAPGADGECRY